MQNKKYAVYIVIAGNYDTVKQPEVIDNRFDYILFSDTHKGNVGVWQVRSISYQTANKQLLSRNPKIHPEKVLSEYDASLYIDGNVQITNKAVYDRCIELYEQGVEWAAIKHQGRKSLFQEINAIIGLGWVHDYDVLSWYKFMRKEGFPDKQGMFENNIIFRTHTRRVEEIEKLWWWSMESGYVKRDQFSLMWAIWKVPGLKTAYFLPENENAWYNDGWFECVAHNPHKRILDKSLWEKLRNRYVRNNYASGGWEIYYTHWFDKLIKWPFPHLAMHLWTMCMLIRYDMGFLIKRLLDRLTLKNNKETKKTKI